MVHQLISAVILLTYQNRPDYIIALLLF